MPQTSLVHRQIDVAFSSSESAVQIEQHSYSGKGLMNPLALTQNHSLPQSGKGLLTKSKKDVTHTLCMAE